MIRKDEENFRDIQQAFRKLAKVYDPHRFRPEGTRKFQHIRQAYETLSNAEKRRFYKQELPQDEFPHPTFSRPQPSPELVVAEPMSLLRDFEAIRPSFEALFERFVRNFTGKGVPKGERLEALNVELILSPEEAASGVTVPVGVPVFYTCRQCGGTGHDWMFPCVSCNSAGMIEVKESLRVRVPPMAPDRTVIEAPIHALGIHNFHLRLHTRISL
jgi:molecular chaperone DnaJ